MPTAKLTGKVTLYRTVHASKADSLTDARELALAYFADRRFTGLLVTFEGINGLGHYDFIMQADPRPAEDRNRVYGTTALPPSESALASTTAATTGTPRPSAVRHAYSDSESLTCEQCGTVWERALTRGRKPRLCPTCVAAKPTPTTNGGIESTETETLICENGNHTFTRPLVRGRKPRLCIEHREI